MEDVPAGMPEVASELHNRICLGYKKVDGGS